MRDYKMTLEWKVCGRVYRAKHGMMTAYIWRYDVFYVNVRGNRNYEVRSPRPYRTLKGAKREAQSMLEALAIIECCL